MRRAGAADDLADAMFVPTSGSGPPESLQPPGERGPPEPEIPEPLRRLGRQVGAAVGLPTGALGGGFLSPADRSGSPDATGPFEEERGPDRLKDMPGGAEALVRVRRARRRELLKEGANVAVGSLVAAVVTGVVLLEGGVGPAASLVSAAAAAGGWAWILGREVVADLARNTELLQRDRDVW